MHSYYDWVKEGKDKLFYFVKYNDNEKGRLVFLAGLYDHNVLRGWCI